MMNPDPPVEELLESWHPFQTLQDPTLLSLKHDRTRPYLDTLPN